MPLTKRTMTFSTCSRCQSFIAKLLGFIAPIGLPLKAI
jgi:hypothetical protein